MLTWLIYTTICAGINQTLLAQTVQNGEIHWPNVAAQATQTGLNLDGQWRFFPQRFLSTEDLATASFEELTSKSQPISVPGDYTRSSYFSLRWQGFYGAGTYLLRLTDLDLRQQPFGLMLRADSAWRLLWFDQDTATGQILYEVGKPALETHAAKPAIADPIVMLPRVKTSRAYLILHVSNYEYRSGSLWKTPILRTYQSLIDEQALISFQEYFCFGAIFIMCIYYLALYSHRREPINLWLSAFSSIVLLRFAATSPLIAKFLFSDSTYGFEWMRKIEYAGGPLAIYFGARFFIHGFRLKIHPIPYRMLSIFSLGISLYTLILPARVHTNYLWLMQITIVAGLLYLLYLVAKVLKRRRTGSRAIALGMLTVFGTASWDLGIGSGLIDSSIFLLHYGIVTIIFCQGQVVAGLFAKAFYRAERLSRDLQGLVEEKTRDISSVMNHVPLGICTISDGLVIDPVHSSYLNRMFPESELAGKNLTQACLSHSNLSSDRLAAIEAALESSIGENEISYQANVPHLPNEIMVAIDDRPHHYELLWHPVTNEEDRVVKLLISFQDVTDLRKLRVKAEADQNRLLMMQECLNLGAERFHRFILVSGDYLEQIKGMLQDERIDLPVDRIYILLHTLKGVARSFQFSLIANSCHQAETQLAAFKNAPEKRARLGFEQTFSVLEQMREQYHDLGHQLFSSKIDLDDITLPKKLALGFLTSHFPHPQSHAHTLTEKVAASIEPQIYSLLAETILIEAKEAALIAKDLQKPLPQITVTDSKLAIEKVKRESFHAFLVHLVRNALDHGIETPAERRQMGKPEQGSISFEICHFESSSEIMIIMSDDGRGLDLQRIAARFREVHPETLCPDDPQLLAQLIFSPDLSTKDTVTDISGRGVGMSAVKEIVEEELGGEISIKLIETKAHASDDPQPFQTCIRLPASLFYQPLFFHRSEGASPRQSA
jgi:HPt (histidine-containing phosphotransfer) domain-containing protein